MQVVVLPIGGVKAKQFLPSADELFAVVHPPWAFDDRAWTTPLLMTRTASGPARTHSLFVVGPQPQW